MITAKRKITSDPYRQAVELLPMFKDKLSALPPEVRLNAQEIRLRSGQAIVIETGKNTRYITDMQVSQENLRELIEIFCGYSLHSYARQLSQGFVTLEGGHRAGFCGTAVVCESGEKITAIRNITSINIRIARAYERCSDELYRLLPIDRIKALLIIGKPMSAKTTILRDFARNLSEGGYKVSIIDERSEIAGSFDLGANTDVLDGFPKKQGFITALRAMSPDFIICDEIGGADESEEVAKCLNSGVGVIMTAHCGSLDEALASHTLRGIIAQTNYIALLGSGQNIGKLQSLWEKDSENENGFSAVLPVRGDGNGFLPFGRIKEAGAPAGGDFNTA